MEEKDKDVGVEEEKEVKKEESVKRKGRNKTTVCLYPLHTCNIGKSITSQRQTSS
jgi:hypothetical protein